MIVAVGANKPGTLELEKGETVNALKFLAEFKATNGRADLGKNVVVIGGGNTAMDTARAAKRNSSSPGATEVVPSNTKVISSAGIEVSDKSLNGRTVGSILRKCRRMHHGLGGTHAGHRGFCAEAVHCPS